MQNKPRYWAVIPAAGVGRRMQVDKPKQYIELLGKTILEHTLETFIDFKQIEKVIVVIGKDDPYWPEIKLSQHAKLITVIGGEERCYSVLNGLLHLQEFADDNDWVMVHDAARPCIDFQQLNDLIEQVSNHPVGGILAYPVRDTMKRSNINNEVIDTVERENLWHAMTPQIFRLEKLVKALKSSIDNKSIVTDEAQAIELTGVKPMLIAAHSYTNKITHIGDLKLAEDYLKNRSISP